MLIMFSIQSLPFMAGFFIFHMRYEMTINEVKMHPEDWGLPSDASAPVRKEASQLPYYKQVANYMYANPFVIVSGLGFPLAGTILYKNLGLTHLTLSQKIMHSRVMAQGGVLIILLTTMAFKGYMDINGRFLEPGETAPSKSNPYDAEDE
jgi:hypothetical protein